MSIRILLISGSTRTGSTNSAALRTVAALAPEEVVAEWYDGLLDLPAFVPGDDDAPAAVTALRARLAAADAVLFCTPEYAGLIPGSLKNLLEWTVGSADLYEKPVAWITVAAPGRGDGAIASLRTVLGYVGADIAESACRAIPVGRDAVAADGTVTDSATRAALATVLPALAAHPAVRAAATERVGGDRRQPSPDPSARHTTA